MKHDFTSRIRIYHELEVTYDHPSSIQDAVAQSTNEPEIFDYRCEDYTFRKLTETPQCQVVQGPVAEEEDTCTCCELTETPQCQVVQGPVAEEEETCTCCECGSRMQHVRPGKWQCLTCENLEVWMSAAKAMQKFRLGYKNLCQPDDVEDES